jgi:Mrp family chromosome partitioning ATPase
LAIKFFKEGGHHMTKCKVIALANQKGGTAKTTTTLNLGIGLAKQGQKVLLVDAEYYGAAEPPVRCGESHLSGLTEPPHFIY